MQDLIDLCQQVKSLNVNSLLIDLYQNKGFRNFIIQANRKQLYDFGIDSNEKKLRSKFARAGEVYAPQTILYKQALGVPTDRITLKDTGEFHESMNLQLTNNTFVVDADTDKETNDLAKTWGINILGLTAENSTKTIELAREIMIPIILNKILNVR